MKSIRTKLTAAYEGAGVPPFVSVVIVNYNGLRFLKDCLDSLCTAFTLSSREAIVVDNASTDGSREYLRSRQDIRLIESDVNLGFAGGNNLGVKAANGSLLLLLNNDTVCLSSLEPMLNCIGDERVGVVGCALFHANGQVQPSIGYEHTPLRVVLSWLGLGKLGIHCRALARLELDAAYYRQPRHAVNWVSGACLLTRTDLWRRLGGLDEHFFMYCEDVDYCKRVRIAGLNVSYTPDAAVRHYEGAGRAWAGKLALRQTAHSYLHLMSKHFGGSARCLTAYSLGVVFILRSMAYSLAYAIGPLNHIRNDKLSAYRSVGIDLIKHGLSAYAPARRK